jgi:hypothetical protein
MILSTVDSGEAESLPVRPRFISERVELGASILYE